MFSETKQYEREYLSIFMNPLHLDHNDQNIGKDLKYAEWEISMLTLCCLKQDLPLTVQDGFLPQPTKIFSHSQTSIYRITDALQFFYPNIDLTTC